MANCRMMNGLDWRTIGYAEYQTMLAGWNAAQSADGKGGAVADTKRLKRFMDAHTLQ
jgi:hypothetical protein